MTAKAAWYVLQVMTGTERECVRRLRGMHMEAFAPSRIMPELSGGKWRLKERAMLPGYVFIRSHMDAADYYRVSGVPDAVRLLPGGGRVEPVPEAQMRWLLTLGRDGEPWGVSFAVMEDGHPRILSGPLAGHEDRLLRWDRRRRRARIAVDVLDRRREIEVGLEEIGIEAACKTHG